MSDLVNQRRNAPDAPHGGRYAAARLLVVDDEQAVADVARAVIAGGLGCTVECAASGDEALARLAGPPCDLLVTDMRMPGVHGLELLRAARAADAGLSVIVMTGYTAEFPYVEVTQAGADDIIHKPFPPQELLAKTIRILDARIERRQRKLAEMKYRSLFERSVDGMLLLDGPSRAILDANHAFRELAARDPEHLIGQTVCGLLDPPDAERFNLWIEVCKAAGRGVLGDLTLLRPNGTQRGVDLTATFIQVEDEEVLFLAFKDVTERRDVSNRLADAAQKDVLTGLYNKRVFETRIESAIARAGLMNGVSLLLVDLDNFKRCNDTHGHQTGDLVLKHVGTAIERGIRGHDCGFRFGGDEFAVLLEGAAASVAVQVAERIQARFAATDTYGTTMSIGLAECLPGMSSAELVKSADQALYRAKAAGKNAIHAA